MTEKETKKVEKPSENQPPEKISWGTRDPSLGEAITNMRDDSKKKR
jgi:hypothetical protein